MINNDELRRRAEEIFDEKTVRSPENSRAPSPEETRLVLHELSVHQIELEMQNEELRRSQEELDASRARYFDLYDLAPVGYITVNESGQIIQANLTATTMLGETRGALVTQRFSRFICKEDQDNYYWHRKQLFETGTAQAWEIRMVKKDGTAFWANFEATTADDADGEPDCRIVLSDISERKNAEIQKNIALEALRQSEARYLAIIEEQTELVCRYLPDGRLSFVNEAYIRYFGKNRQEILNRNYIPNIPSPDINLIREQLKTITPAAPCTEFEHRIIMSDGTVRWHYWTHQGIFSPEGEIREYQAVGRDITEHKAAEERIRSLNADLEQLALTDYLTSLFNRRYFMQRGSEEFKRSRRNNQLLSVLMLDIDEFKIINDTHGHEAGDLALQLVATALKSCLREVDILGRLGGEEFAVLLPNTLLDTAESLAERIRQTIEILPFRIKNNATVGKITISIGVAAFTDTMSGIDDLLRSADAALYQAKNGGRNCVGVYDNYSQASFVSGTENDRK